ncbi:thermonuclease family protein [Bacillus cereus]|uniref:thermonuclease family protein n=1 Tax=Bacillus cereus TaxID=1396 RepID=UPI0021178AF1|nr:thermonuclease family protein [Bacillus cereus]
MKVRALLLDTTDSFKQSYPVQAYDKKAPNFAKSLVEGKNIEIISKKDDTKNHFGRYLGYGTCEGKLVQ